MEARMDEDEILSMMRALLGAQQRGLASPTTNHHGLSTHDYQSASGAGSTSWEPTGHGGFEGQSDSWEPTGENGFDHTYTYKGAPYAQENDSGYDAGYRSWEPPSNQGFDGSDCYQGGLYDQAHQSGYEDAYPPWDMQYDNGGPYSSPISIQEDHYNMIQLLLEGQARHHDLINSLAFGMPSTTPTAAATAHVEPFSPNLTTTFWTDEDNSDCISVQETSPMEVPPIDTGGRFEDITPLKDDFLQAADLPVAEFEHLLGCTVDETLMLHYARHVDHVVPLRASPMGMVVCDTPCIGDLVVTGIGTARASTTIMYELSTTDVLHEQSNPPLLALASPLADASQADQGNRSPLPSPFAKPLASNPHTAAPNGHPWRLPYAQIRMNEFGGWFYDEYDPGDPRFRRVHLDTSTWDFSQA